MHKMKPLLAIVMLVGLAACSKNDRDPAKDNLQASAPSAEDEYSAFKKVASFDGNITAINANESYIYLTTNNDELKRCDWQGVCSTIDTLNLAPQGVSIDDKGNGFVITQDGNVNEYMDNKFIATATTLSQDAVGVQYVSASKTLYIITQPSGNNDRVAGTNQLVICDIAGNCHVKNDFAETPTSLSFDARGNGYVLTKANNGDDTFTVHVNKYRANEQISDNSNQLNSDTTSIDYLHNKKSLYVLSTRAAGTMVKCNNFGVNCGAIIGFKLPNSGGNYGLSIYDESKYAGFSDDKLYINNYPLP